MKLVYGDLRAPGCCVICLKTTLQTGQYMVDTNERNDYGVVSPRTGDIFICCACVDTMAKLAGYLSPDDAAAVAQMADDTRAEAAGTRELLLKVEELIKTRLAAQAD